MAVKRDITRELELELQLRQSRKMEAIGRLAGGVAHDFNNLLQTIAGTADLLLAVEEEGSPKRRDIEEILRATETGCRLVQQLLNVGATPAFTSRAPSISVPCWKTHGISSAAFSAIGSVSTSRSPRTCPPSSPIAACSTRFF